MKDATEKEAGVPELHPEPGAELEVNPLIAGAFHSYGGWYWKRLEDGTVRIFLLNEGGHLLTDHEVDPNTWASIVAHVSADGENALTFERAQELHVLGLDEDDPRDAEELAREDSDPDPVG